MFNRLLLSFIFILILICLILVFYFLYIKHNQYKSPVNIESQNNLISKLIEGTIISIDYNLIKINSDSNTEVSLIISEDTKFFDTNSKNFSLQDIKIGFNVKAKGQASTKSSLITSELTVTNEPNIILVSPNSSEVVSKVFEIKGIARVFENTLALTLTNTRNKGNYLKTNLTTDARDLTKYGNFSYLVDLKNISSLKEGDVLELKLFQYSPKDKKEQGAKKTTLIFRENKIQQVFIYLPNDKLNSQKQCDKVFSVEREIDKTTSITKETVEQLLKGPTPKEQDKGFLTNIPKGTRLQKITITNNIAFVEFSHNLYLQNDLCINESINSQISQTLLQFPAIKEVKISAPKPI